MRNVRPFQCPECGDEPVGLTSCSRCKVPLQDSRGQPIEEGRSLYSYRALTTANVVVTVLICLIMGGVYAGLQITGESSAFGRQCFGMAALIICLFTFLWQIAPSWLDGKAHAARARENEARLAAAGPVVPIAQASATAHIRGTVKVLTALRHERVRPEENLAAVLFRERGERVVQHGTKSRPFAESIGSVCDSLASGRFAVVDDSGIAIVDEDCFDVWPPGGLNRTRNYRIDVRDGDVVEIVGSAQWEAAPEAIDLAHAGRYRDRADQALVFDGTREEPVIIVAKERTPAGA